MDKQKVAECILEIGIIPVVRAATSQQALAAVDAIFAGGIPIVEITMTVPGAIEMIRAIAVSRSADILVGAGTVLDEVTAQRCIDAGAEFIVSPGLDVKTVEQVGRAGRLMMAGALTPTEAITAWKAGSDFVKIFPCGHVGGAAYIKALKGPLPGIPLVPTGGVNLQTAAAFIEAGSAALGVGGELVQAAALRDGKPEIISEAARQFRAVITQVRLKIAAAAKSPR